jgi:predicted ferric reductase
MLGQVKAIMGKGLGINEKDGGTHIAFTAGTGILPFIDLVALLLRVNLGLVKTEQLSPIFHPNSTFKLVLYVSFDSRKDSLALELLEGLYEIT